MAGKQIRTKEIRLVLRTGREAPATLFLVNGDNGRDIAGVWLMDIDDFSIVHWLFFKSVRGKQSHSEKQLREHFFSALDESGAHYV